MAVGTLTVAAVAAIIAHGNCVPKDLAPVMIAIARHESGLDPNVVNVNKNGTRDAGLVQVNEINWGWTGLKSLKDALDPCKNIAAGAKVLLAKYNGNSPNALKGVYANSVLGKFIAVDTPVRLVKNSHGSSPAVRTRRSAAELFVKPRRGARVALNTGATYP